MAKFRFGYLVSLQTRLFTVDCHFLKGLQCELCPEPDLGGCHSLHRGGNKLFPTLAAEQIPVWNNT
jgi:hypothetical protein